MNDQNYRPVNPDNEQGPCANCGCAYASHIAREGLIPLSPIKFGTQCPGFYAHHDDIALIWRMIFNFTPTIAMEEDSLNLEGYLSVSLTEDENPKFLVEIATYTPATHTYPGDVDLFQDSEHNNIWSAVRRCAVIHAENLADDAIAAMGEAQRAAEEDHLMKDPWEMDAWDDLALEECGCPDCTKGD